MSSLFFSVDYQSSGSESVASGPTAPGAPGTCADVHAEAHLEAYTVRVGTSSLSLWVRGWCCLTLKWEPLPWDHVGFWKEARLCAGPLTPWNGADSKPAFWFAPARKRGGLKCWKLALFSGSPTSSFSFFSPASDAARRRGKWGQGSLQPWPLRFLLPHISSGEIWVILRCPHILPGFSSYYWQVLCDLSLSATARRGSTRPIFILPQELLS